MFDPTTLHLLAVGLWETLYMTLFSTFFVIPDRAALRSDPGSDR